MTPSQCDGQQSGVLYELSALVLNLLRLSQTPISFSAESSLIAPPTASPSCSSRRPSPQITPAGFASLLLGASLTLMLCGSVTFFIGFMLMPCVFGLFMAFRLAGMVSAVSVLGRSIIDSVTTPPGPPKK